MARTNATERLQQLLAEYESGQQDKSAWAENAGGWGAENEKKADDGPVMEEDSDEVKIALTANAQREALSAVDWLGMQTKPDVEAVASVRATEGFVDVAAVEPQQEEDIGTEESLYGGGGGGAGGSGSGGGGGGGGGGAAAAAGGGGGRGGSGSVNNVAFVYSPSAVRPTTRTPSDEEIDTRVPEPVPMAAPEEPPPRPVQRVSRRTSSRHAAAPAPAPAAAAAPASASAPPRGQTQAFWL